MPGKGAPTPPIIGRKVTNIQVLTQSILDCRKAYSGLSDLTFSKWYERKYGIKSARVLEILGAQSQGPGGAA